MQRDRSLHTEYARDLREVVFYFEGPLGVAFEVYHEVFDNSLDLILQIFELIREFIDMCSNLSFFSTVNKVCKLSVDDGFSGSFDLWEILQVVVHFFGYVTYFGLSGNRITLGRFLILILRKLW